MRIIKLFPFLPLSFFVWYMRFHGYSELAWHDAFIISGTLAFILRLIFMYKKISVNPFMRAINMFLIFGGIGFLFDIKWILKAYEYFEQAILFIWIIIIGFSCTLFTPTGFIHFIHHDKSAIKKASWYLVLGSLGAFGISFALRGNMILAGIAPFVFLIVLKKFLIKTCFIHQSEKRQVFEGKEKA